MFGVVPRPAVGLAVGIAGPCAGVVVAVVGAVVGRGRGGEGLWVAITRTVIA